MTVPAPAVCHACLGQRVVVYFTGGIEVWDSAGTRSEPCPTCCCPACGTPLEYDCECFVREDAAARRREDR